MAGCRRRRDEQDRNMAQPQNLSPEGLLRLLAAPDKETVESVLGTCLAQTDPRRLDARTCALVRIGALLAMDATAPAYEWVVGLALAVGANVDEIVGQ